MFDFTGRALKVITRGRQHRLGFRVHHYQHRAQEGVALQMDVEISRRGLFGSWPYLLGAGTSLGFVFSSGLVWEDIHTAAYVDAICYISTLQGTPLNTLILHFYNTRVQSILLFISRSSRENALCHNRNHVWVTYARRKQN